MILSFDIGIKNLAYCILYKDLTINNEKNLIIHKWGIINILEDNEKCKDISLDEIGTRMYKRLQDEFLEENITEVLLENQPVLKNPVMKSIQILIMGFFKYESVILGREIKLIKLINASNKLKLGKKLIQFNESEDILKIKSKYNRNKKLAILYTNYFLEKELYSDYNKYNTLFNEHKKKDDLSDAFLQGLYYIKNN
mgnify:FL=1|tara:strand:- start:811 stop:1401 length:591 start_codon:yes stop_codon:yes gene_type:complete